MSNSEIKAGISAAAVRKLENLHSEFLLDLRKLEDPPADLGEIEITDSSIKCRCLGHEVPVRQKPVSIGGYLRAIEYEFFTNWRGEEVILCHLYLHPDGNISRDASGETQFHEFTNRYLKKSIVSEVCNSLVLSQIYRPAKG